MILSNLHRITLTPRAVQEHMKGDPEYGAAVQCLRICECTFEDVEPFNSHILKSATKENGVDMGEPFHFAAATIVQTNLLHETLNLRKAQANTDLHNPLILRTALNQCTDKQPNCHEQEQFLNLKLTSSKIQNALPGFVPLYVEMPIVL